MPTILVTGGRDFKDRELLNRTLDDLCDDRGWIGYPDYDGNYLPTVTIVHGGATGADALADTWAIINWCPIKEYKVTPLEWKIYGKAAGSMRNQRMLDETNPDLIVAFPTPKSKGTWDMVRRAETYKKNVNPNAEIIIIE